MTNYPNSRKANIVVQEFENEVLIYDLNINKALCLNQTSALVYQLSDGTRTVSEISELMSKKLKTLVSEDLVWLSIDGLKKDNLLENADEVPLHFAGLSRREVIKKIGLGSIIALPVIASVIAPSSVLAQSCILAGNPAPGTLLSCRSAFPGGCASSCNTSNSSQCCSMTATASNPNNPNCDFSVPDACTCFCL